MHKRSVFLQVTNLSTNTLRSRGFTNWHTIRLSITNTQLYTHTHTPSAKLLMHNYNNCIFIKNRYALAMCMDREARLCARPC